MQQHNAFNPAAEEWTSGKSAIAQRRAKNTSGQECIEDGIGVDGM